ncbi:MAG: ABC transporter permease [Hyphomicrobium sp.]|nr:ABC transporter permease [Hyphomicrobium sp.]
MIDGIAAQNDVSQRQPAERKLRRRSGAPLRFVHGLAGLGLIVLAWWIATDLLAAPDSLEARFAPQATFSSLFQLLSSSDLALHVAVSLKRILVGLVLALAIGVPVGLVVGLNKTVEAATSPAFQLLRMISPLSWMPIAVMVLGVGDYPIYFLLTFAAVWPILLNTAAGVRHLDPAWLTLSRSLCATPWENLIHVVIPGVVGHVLTGVRLAIGILWIVLVPCEMLGVSAGLGYMILDTRDRLAYSELMAMVIVIGLLGFLLDAAARALHSRWLPASSE